MTRFLARELSTAHWYNLDAARRDLGYAPEVTIEEGLARLAQSFQAGEQSRPQPALAQGERSSESTCLDKINSSQVVGASPGLHAIDPTA